MGEGEGADEGEGACEGEGEGKEERVGVRVRTVRGARCARRAQRQGVRVMKGGRVADLERSANQSETRKIERGELGVGPHLHTADAPSR